MVKRSWGGWPERFAEVAKPPGGRPKPDRFAFGEAGRERFVAEATKPPPGGRIVSPSAKPTGECLPLRGKPPP